MTCSCPAAGYCATYGKRQSERMRQICRGEVLTADKCEVYRMNWLGAALAAGIDPLPCLHRGESIGAKVQRFESKQPCATCASRGDRVELFACELHGQCTLRPWQIGQAEAVCATCAQREALVPKPWDRRRLTGLAHSQLNFNNSIVPVTALSPASRPPSLAVSYLMAYRFGWDDARVALAELDAAYRVVHQQILPLRAGLAREDPRLFIYGGQLHVSYSAVQLKSQDFWTDVAYARLKPRGLAADGWGVEQEFVPRYAGRNYWEKNWGFFEREGQLYCLYSIRPHQVLKIEGRQAQLAAVHHNAHFPKIGHLHGGAPPVRHGDEYYCFFHTVLGGGSDRWYSLDLYTFHAEPPFEPRRVIRLPLLTPTRSDRPAGHVPHCIFPGGAFFDEQRQRWVVSFGYYDKYSELVEFDAADVERCLTPLPAAVTRPASA